MISLTLTVLMVSLLPPPISPHGSLVLPPSRAVMNTHGFPDNPVDYDWSAGYCGGRYYQWNEAGGRCGICGDPWGAEVREHEAPGGKFANGIIVGQYQSGQVIPVTSHITANHVGFVEFRLCRNNNVTQDPGQECFDDDEAVLSITRTGEGCYTTETDRTKLWIEDVGSGLFSAEVRLPQWECSQCILQWTYRNGRDWGSCNGACGEVETFKACADIAIVRADTDTTEAVTEGTTPDSTTADSTTADSTTEDSTTADSTTITQDVECRATGAWTGQTEMDAWCDLNCHHDHPFCPPDICTCGSAQTQTKTCQGVGFWSSSQAVESWCRDNCLRVSRPFCPPTICNCS